MRMMSRTMHGSREWMEVERMGEHELGSSWDGKESNSKSTLNDCKCRRGVQSESRSTNGSLETKRVSDIAHRESLEAFERESLDG